MQAGFIRVASISGLSVIVLALGSTAGRADSPEPPPSRPGSAAADPCSLPLAKRTGGWACPDEQSATPVESLRKARAALGSEKISDADIADVAAGTGFCDIQGCWTQVDAYRTTYSLSAGTYGYGRTPLGTMAFTFKTVTAGTKFTVWATSFKTNSRGNTNGWINREILYLSAAYPGGNSQSPRQFSLYNDPDHVQTVNTWLSAPEKAWYESIQQPTAAVEVGWHDPSSAYPGEWYTYAKSIKYKRQSNSTYTTQGTDRPSDAAGAGWHP